MQSTNNYLNFCRIYLLRLIQILFIFNIIICLFILQTTLLIKENKNNNILINNYTLKDKLKNKIIRSVRLLDERKKEINKNNNLNVGPGEKLNIPIKGGIVPIEWFNFKIINPQRFGRRLGDLRFEVLNQPKYGQLQFNSDISNSREIPLNSFLYSDVLNKKVLYKHFKDSTIKHDKFKLGVDISLFSRRAGGGGRISKTGNLINSDQFDIEIDVNEKENNNEIKEKIPKILIEPIGEVINLKIGKRLQLNSNNLRIYNKDISNENILINVEEISENSLDLINKMGERLRQFSLSELLKGNIYLIGLENEEKVDNDNNYELNEDKEGYIKLVAINDFGIQSEPAIIRVLFVPLKIIFDKNIGIQMIHYSSKQIESSQLYSYCISEYNLSFIPSAYYLIVNQPNFGIIECLRNNFNEKNNKKWSICSSFTQNEINLLKVRYTNKRSTNMLLPPKSDDFDFQVFCSSTASLIQNFQIDFITLSIRVFIQETLKLNQTDQGLISRQNILATVFPQHFTTDQLYFNIIEAPKLGMLLRLVIETGRHRRVGISSNITQKQIDEGLFFYKLHFAPFSVLNDFFTFRLLTPAGASEEIFRFDIVYLPGGGIGEIKLKNNTLIIEEGKIQEITNNTLWLESSDGNNNYLFRVILPPMNGILFLLNKNENKKNILDFDDIFNSNDILENKLYYKHYGDLSKWDRIYLIAESKIRDPGGGKGYTPLPFFLSISIIGINKRKPQLFSEMYGENFEKNKNLFLLENNEITLLPSHIQLIDLDNLIKWPKSLENFKQFSIANSINSLNFNVIPEPLNSRDFIIFEKELPEIPLREFNENLLNKGNLIIKNVGSAINGTLLKITATDGLNNKTLPISIFSISKYFLRLSTPNKIYFNINLNKQKEQQPLFLLISIVHLFVETNIDIFNDNQIIFEVINLKLKLIILKVQTIIPNLSPFRLLLQNGTFVKTILFTQKDILQNKLFFELNEQNQQNLTQIIFLKLFTTQNEDIFEEIILKIIFQNSSNISLLIPIFIKEKGLNVQSGGSSLINEQILNIPINDDNYFIKFFIIKQPIYGNIIFQRKRKLNNDSTTITSSSSSLQSIYNLPLSSFDNKILNSNSLFYLNKNKEEINKDNFLINLIIQSKENLKIFIQIGPINIPINIITNYLNNNEIKEINKFNKYLGNNLILKKNNPIILDYYFNKTFIKITSEYLQVQSFGISTNKIKFLIWHSIGGIIKYLLSNNLTKKINNFTQEDINQGKIIFQFNKQNNNNNFSGFYFLYSDGINQNNNAEWFLIKQEILNNNLKENIKLINKDYGIERNLILKTTPGIPSIIGPEVLKVVGNYEPDKIIYRLTTPPNHGRLFLRDAQEKLERFTQLDINLNKLIYQTSSTSLGVWKLLDEFGFKIYTTKNNFNENEPKEFKFNIENAYSNIKLNEINKLINLKPINISKGGSIAININYLNLTKLSEYTEDNILIQLKQLPNNGWLQRLDNIEENNGEELKENEKENLNNKYKWNKAINMEQLHSGQYLIYRHLLNISSSFNNNNKDNFTLIIYGFRGGIENLIKINILINLFEPSKLLNVHHFPQELFLVSGGTLQLNSNLISTSHSILSDSSIFYKIIQTPQNGVNFIFKEEGEVINNKSFSSFPLILNFTQEDINKGFIWLEHNLINEKQLWNVIEYYFVLIIRIEPLALQLRNFTEITYIQGKNYVLLNRSHLGAESNGERSKIYYNITKAPENGTFYWVNGEKELNGFTQINIDNNEVLYSQMNMNAYQGSSPRYSILPNGIPKNGRFFVHPYSNESTLFFTHDDIVNGRLYFHAFDVKYRTINNIIIELRSDRVQPALIYWTIIIRPLNNIETIDEPQPKIIEEEKYKSQPKQQNQKTFLDNQIIPPPPPDMNYHFPIAILIAVVLLVVGILLCRKKTPQEEIVSSEDGKDNNNSNTTIHYQQQRSNGTNNINKNLNIEKRNGSSKQHKKSVPENGINQRLNSVKNQPRMSTPSSCLNNLGNSGNDLNPKNLLESTVYAAINNKKDSIVSRNKYTQDSESTFHADDGGVYIGEENKIKKLELPLLITPSYASATIPSLISNQSEITYLNTGTLKEKDLYSRRRSDSTRPSILTIRNDSKEKQKLLASAVSAAFASKNIEERRKEFSIPKEENEQLKIETNNEEDKKIKNNEKEKSTEFWV